jgi:hypothetical protein
MNSPWIVPAFLLCLVCILPVTLGAGVFALLRAVANRNPVLHAWREPDPENQNIVHHLYDLSMMTRKERKEQKQGEE